MCSDIAYRLHSTVEVLLSKISIPELKPVFLALLFTINFKANQSQKAEPSWGQPLLSASRKASRKGQHPGWHGPDSCRVFPSLWSDHVMSTALNARKKLKNWLEGRGGTKAVVLEALPCEVRFSWEKGQLWRPPEAALAPSGGDAARLCPGGMVGWVEGRAQAEA